MLGMYGYTEEDNQFFEGKQALGVPEQLLDLKFTLHDLIGCASASCLCRVILTKGKDLSEIQTFQHIQTLRVRSG